MPNRIYKNLAVMTAAQLLNKLLGFVWLFLSARYLGSQGFGVLSIGTSIAMIFSVLMEFGLSSFMIREVARDHQLIPVFVRNYFFLKGILGFSALILVWLVVLILGYPADVSFTTIIIASSMLVFSFTSIATSVYFGTERMEFPCISSIVAKICSLGLGILFIKMGCGLLWIAGVLLLERLCEFGVNYYYLTEHHPITIRQRLDPAFLRRVVRESLPFALASFFGILYYKIDVIILSKFTNETQVGWYSAGFRFQDSLVLFFGSFVNTVFPVLSRQFGTGQITRSVVRSLEFILMCVVPISLFLFFLPDKIVLTVYGAQFARSAPVVRLLAIALPFTSMTYFLGATLGAINKQRAHFYITLLAVLLNLALNLALVYHFQYVGAAMSAVITAACIWVLYAWVASINIVLPVDWTFAGKFVLPCLGIVSVVLLHLGLITTLILGTLTYILLLFATKLIGKPELQGILSTFKRSNYA